MMKNKLPKGLTGNNISIRSEFLGSSDGSRVKYAYEMRYKRKIIFSGRDFSPSPLWFSRHGYGETLGKKALYSLLGFLTLQPGDTDKEYFQNYTQEQLDFVKSQDADNIRLALYDFENKTEG